MNEGSRKQHTVVKMGNIRIELFLNLNGGSYFDFHLKDLSVNPINWRGTEPEEKDVYGALCLFRSLGSTFSFRKIKWIQASW